MLYMFHVANHPDIEYRGGQEALVHLVADLRKTVSWADEKGLRWAFTNSNAGSNFFEDFADLADLDEIGWDAVEATQWGDRSIRDKKQAEFLLERHFPWELITEIGVYSFKEQADVRAILGAGINNPPVRIQRERYY
jgi:hypothetical protein